VRIVNGAKRAALSRLLLESVLSTEPGEKLDTKLASLTLPANFADREDFHRRLFKANDPNHYTFSSVPEFRGYGMVGLSRLVFDRYAQELVLKNGRTDHPNGVVLLATPQPRRKTNPFDSPIDSPLSSSPSSSDEELYSRALSLPTPIQPSRKLAPPPPPSRSTKPVVPLVHS